MIFGSKSMIFHGNPRICVPRARPWAECADGSHAHPPRGPIFSTINPAKNISGPFFSEIPKTLSRIYILNPYHTPISTHGTPIYDPSIQILLKIHDFQWKSSYFHGKSMYFHTFPHFPILFQKIINNKYINK